MRKKAAITESKLLVGAMELIGVKVIWAQPGEAIRTLREMCESLRAGTRARVRTSASARVDDRGGANEEEEDQAASKIALSFRGQGGLEGGIRINTDY